MNHFEKVREILADQLLCEPEDISLTSFIREDLGADSLDMLELTIAIEELYDIEIPDETIAQIRTVTDLVTLLESTD